MIDLHFRPQPKWTEKTPLEGRSSHFKTPYVRTLELLEYELRKLAADDIILEAGFTLLQLRSNGWPKVGETPSHAGVVLYFKSADGALRFPCGTYSSYESNIHAITLTLEALRAINRYGVTVGHEQYRGFLALPAAPETMTVEGAAGLLANWGGGAAADIVREAATYRTIYRNAAAALHPDKHPELRGQWDLLTIAKTLLDAHHKVEPGAPAT